MKVILLDLDHIVAVSEDVDGVQHVSSYGLHDIPEPCSSVIRHALQHTYGKGHTMKVTQQQIEARIKNTRYINDGTLTICIVELDNGFKAVGESACVDPLEYNRGLGETLARSRAMASLWSAFGFQLAERMYERKCLDLDGPKTGSGVRPNIGYDDEKRTERAQYGDTQNGTDAKKPHDGGTGGAKLPSEMRVDADYAPDSYMRREGLLDDAPHGDIEPAA